MDDGEVPQNGETVENRNTVNNSNTVDNGKAAKNRKEAKGSKTAKITIYPTQEQVQKLYDLMEAYRRRTGFRINQQDMIRRLIDVANEDTVLP